MQRRVTVISIGAAVQDVFLQGEIFNPHREHGSLVAEFALGSKNEIEDITYSTGGGATNASVTFSRQGLKSYYMGKIGKDVAGRAVLEELRNENVDTSLISYSERYGTGYSSILLAPNGERTILTYRGASEHYRLRSHDFLNRTADWIYISSLSGDIESLHTIAAYAKKHGIKIAINPGKGELKERVRFKEILSACTILSLNKEEMIQLFGGDSPRDILKEASSYVPIVLLTDGPKGSYATDGHELYAAGMYEDVKVIDRAGAGDAFSSGFTSQIALGKTIEDALVYASANSTSVVSKIGAKAGILHAHSRLHSMPIKKSPL